MFKLTAAIRNHFVLIPCLEVKDASPRTAKRTLAPIAPHTGFPSRSAVAVPKLSGALRTPMHPAELEAMNASLGEDQLSVSIPSMRPDPALASLACKAPNLCSLLEPTQRKPVRGS